jgi:hypothetical protein
MAALPPVGGTPGTGRAPSPVKAPPEAKADSAARRILEEGVTRLPTELAIGAPTEWRLPEAKETGGVMAGVSAPSPSAAPSPAPSPADPRGTGVDPTLAAARSTGDLGASVFR